MAHILLLEPDRNLAYSYTEALKAAGYSITAAVSAQEAVDSADKLTPSVVIMELRLSAHNGIEFLYEFRSYPEWMHIPIVILSMVPPNEFLHTKSVWEKLQINDYLYKPQTSLKRLIDTVDELLVEHL